MMKFRSSAFLLLAMVSAASMAQVTSVAPTNGAAFAASGNSFGPFAFQPRLQLFIADTELTAHVGRRISAITFRAMRLAPAAVPPSFTILSFNVRLSQSVALPMRSTTFASNIVGSQTLCRAGLLEVPAGSFPAGSIPNAFGPDITFTTSYFYTGGPLLMDIDNQFTVGFPQWSVEGFPVGGPPANVYGIKVAAIQGTMSGTTGTAVPFPTTRITSVPNPTVTGTVDFGQLGSSPFNSGANLPTSIPVSFRNASNAQIATGTATYNPLSGAFSVSVPISVSVPYRVSFKHGFWLRKTMPDPANPAAPFGSYSFGSVAPLVGDADDDNAITPSDYGIWQLENGNFVTENTSADFDGDGAITPSDYGLWQVNNGAFGDD